MTGHSRTWWRDLSPTARRRLWKFYRGLERRFGPFDPVARQYARLAAEAWWNARHASETAMAAAEKRRDGKGRRPKAQLVDRQMKRAGLNVGTFDELVKRLEGLAGSKRDLTTALKERLR